MSVKLIEHKPAMHITIQIWFAHTWRSMLWLLLPILLIVVMALTSGFLTGMMGGGEEADAVMLPVTRVLAGVLGVFGAIWAWHKALTQILGKTFSGYRLALLTPESANMTDDAGT